MKLSQIVLTSFLLISCAVACREQEIAFTDNAILFSSDGITKGFLVNEENSFLTIGTKVKVFDYVTGFDGTIDETTYSSSDTFRYFDDVVQYDGRAFWPYTDATKEYMWTKSGTHRFFGYLEYDRSYNLQDEQNSGLSTSSFFGSSPTVNNSMVLTTPVKSFSTSSSSAQYDFLYSKRAILRNASDYNYDFIPIQLKHMFTAVGLSFLNKSSETTVQITGISTNYVDPQTSLTRDLFLHKGYATVDYSSNAPDISPTYVLEGDMSNPFFSVANISSTVITPNKKYDIITGEELTGNQAPTCFMTWPLTKYHIYPQTVVGQDAFGDPIYVEYDNILELTYKANGGAPETTRVKFPRRDWEAGRKVQLVIEFTDKSIQMVAEVLPWDYNEQEMDFNGDSVTVPDGGKLTLEGEGAPEELAENATIHLTTTYPEAHCKVFISSLKGCTLLINKVGNDPEYFDVTPATMTITGEKLQFVVKPSDLPTGNVPRTMRLSFSVLLSDGREIDGDSEILGTDHNYTFSRQ